MLKEAVIPTTQTTVRAAVPANSRGLAANDKTEDLGVNAADKKNHGRARGMPGKKVLYLIDAASRGRRGILQR